MFCCFGGRNIKIFNRQKISLFQIILIFIHYVYPSVFWLLIEKYNVNTLKLKIYLKYSTFQCVFTYLFSPAFSEKKITYGLYLPALICITMIFLYTLTFLLRLPSDWIASMIYYHLFHGI